MGFFSQLREQAITRLGGEPDRAGVTATISDLREQMSDMALRLRPDTGNWAPLGSRNGGVDEFNHQARQQNAAACRVFAVTNPLAKQGLGIRAAYVWGTGLGITATDPAVNEVIQGFLDDPANRGTFTGHLARLSAESALSTDGNVFTACFTDPITGRVQARLLPSTEITNIITNPEDSSEPWYYQRNHLIGNEQAVTLYPALGYNPVARPRTIEGHRVEWSAPVYHTKDGAPQGWQYGVGDLYAAVPWVRAYDTFLTDWARLTRSLSMIAYKITGKTKSDTQAARLAAQQAMASGAPGGALAMTGADIQAMPSTGAKIDATSGDPLARMVAAALGLPVTQLLGDPGSTGARAVAETLTQPMVLRFKNRREVWTETYRAILNYVIDAQISAPQGALAGSARIRAGRKTRHLTTGERTLVFDWPEIEDIPLGETLGAVETLDSTGLAPKETLARLALRALRVRDVDELLDSMRDGNGEFIPAGADLADALLASYQAGERA